MSKLLQLYWWISNVKLTKSQCSSAYEYIHYLNLHMSSEVFCRCQTKSVNLNVLGVESASRSNRVEFLCEGEKRQIGHKYPG